MPLRQGLCLYDKKEKWWLVIATVIAVFLAWGSHFMWFTRLWFDYAPLYSKFRTVSMALVVLQVTLPILGFIVLDRILKAGIISTAVTGGFCLIFALMPGIAGTFTSASDSSLPDILTSALAADRKTMLVHDAIRSLVLVLCAAGAVYFFSSSKKSKGMMAAGITMAVLVAIDLFPVGKRYLNKEHFVSKREFSGQFAQRPVDKVILQDKSLDYRVIDISVNTFNDSHLSYWHKSIGGYSPAKMQRYQDLIDRYLNGEIANLVRTVNSSATIQDIQDSLPPVPVISMLNGRYIVIGAEYASPDEEIALLGSTDLRNSAVIGEDFLWARERLDSLSALPRTDNVPADSIWMTSYAPNELRYKSRSISENAVIFSEIYYPDGWTLTIDGKPAPMFRADWILRGAFIPAGEHEIVMRFEPRSYAVGENVSRASSIVLILLLVLSAAGAVFISVPRGQDPSRD